MSELIADAAVGDEGFLELLLAEFKSLNRCISEHFLELVDEVESGGLCGWGMAVAVFGGVGADGK